jgi:hypothetical protein
MQLCSVADPGCLSRIPDPDFFPSRIQDPKTATKERGEKNLGQFSKNYTVGAQTIAPAQSIAHGQIGDSISQKNKIFEKLFFTKDKKW